jgi:hypothetical protein
MIEKGITMLDREIHILRTVIIVRIEINLHFIMLHCIAIYNLILYFTILDYQGYDYGTNYNSNYYAYLENLRRTDPAAYAEWYHKYYQHHQQIARGVTTNYSEDRASVHSGRSSCDDR